MALEEGARRSPRANRRELMAYARPAGWQNPDHKAPYDLLVVGAGPAGLAAAEAAVDGGAKVALIERHLLGGVSLLTGSVPSKSIIRTSRLYADMRDAAKFGAAVPSGIQENFAATMQRMRGGVRSDEMPSSSPRDRRWLIGMRIGAGILPFRIARGHRTERREIPAQGRTRCRPDTLRIAGARRRRDPFEHRRGCGQNGDNGRETHRSRQ